MKRKVNKKILQLTSIVLALIMLLSSTIATNASSYKKDLINVNSIANNENYNNYIKDINNAPSLLKNNCNNIIFVDEDLNKKFNLNFNNCIVFAISSENNIYIDTNYYNKNVVTHELCHVYDYSHNWISESKDFQTVYKSENNNISVSKGNNQNSYEFFASAGELFFNNPSQLKKVSYSTYLYFENIFK